MRRVLVPAIILAALAGDASAQTPAVAASAADATNHGIPATPPASMSSQASSHYNAGVSAYNAGNFAAAVKEWRQAAMAGDPRAQFGLGQLYEQGRGVIQSRVQAHAWYNIAASQGLAVATEARDRLTKSLTAEQLADAERQAQAFQPGAPTTPQPAASPAVTPAMPQELFKAAEAGDVAKIHAILAKMPLINDATYAMMIDTSLPGTSDSNYSVA